MSSLSYLGRIIQNTVKSDAEGNLTARVVLSVPLKTSEQIDSVKDIARLQQSAVEVTLNPTQQELDI